MYYLNVLLPDGIGGKKAEKRSVMVKQAFITYDKPQPTLHFAISMSWQR